MARFLLTDKHYLNVPGTEWEQRETDQISGKQVRKVYPVCLYLDPDDPADHNYPKHQGFDGQIIVTTVKSKEFPRDILFIGHPTMAMEPLDPEAEVLLEDIRKKWIHPIESLSPISESPLLAQLQSQVFELQAKVNSNAEQRVKELEARLAKYETAAEPAPQPRPVSAKVGIKLGA